METPSRRLMDGPSILQGRPSKRPVGPDHVGVSDGGEQGEIVEAVGVGVGTGEVDSTPLGQERYGLRLGGAMEDRSGHPSGIAPIRHLRWAPDPTGESEALRHQARHPLGCRARQPDLLAPIEVRMRHGNDRRIEEIGHQPVIDPPGRPMDLLGIPSRDEGRREVTPLPDIIHPFLSGPVVAQSRNEEYP